MISPIHQQQLRQLASASGRSVSLFLPTHRQGPETRQDAIRLKNTIDRARVLLNDADSAGGGLEKQVASFYERIDHKDFWDHQGEGLAVFFQENFEQMFRLPCPVPEQVYVGEEFLLRPLLPQRHVDQPYTVVALTWDDGKLYSAGSETIEEWKNEQFPFSRPDLVALRESEEQLQYSSHQKPSGSGGGINTAMYHGHGEGEQKLDADRQHYLLHAAERIAAVRKQVEGPLLLVATEELSGHLPQSAHEAFDAVVPGSPANSTPGELFRRTREAANRCAAEEESTRLDQLGTALANQQGSKQVEEILPAAFDGRIATLIVHPDQTVLGQYDPTSRTVADVEVTPLAKPGSGEALVHQGLKGGTRELANLAVRQTLLTDGQLLVSERLGNAPLAAIYRY